MDDKETVEWNLKHPILITGLPRSGTSLVTSIFEACGMWVGSYHTSPDNPRGFFENMLIRDGFVKTLLWYNSYSIFGVPPLPHPETIENDLADEKNPIKQLLIDDGYTGDKIWGYKDAKMLLMPYIWNSMFPEATWVVVERNPDDVLKSIMNSFMNEGTGELPKKQWVAYIEAMLERIAYLEEDMEVGTLKLDIQKIFAWDLSEIEQAVKTCGLIWNETAVAQRIDPTLWKRWERNT